ncbi:hypothetical protein DFJ74DRAFT_63671 [Hyaloraphidium curvatum]|nr:hypothetical protein DFJ74DRAFT_63671 [Hyaloraphidium curvatum]
MASSTGTPPSGPRRARPPSGVAACGNHGSMRLKRGPNDGAKVHPQGSRPIGARVIGIAAVRGNFLGSRRRFVSGRTERRAGPLRVEPTSQTSLLTALPGAYRARGCADPRRTQPAWKGVQEARTGCLSPAAAGSLRDQDHACADRRRPSRPTSHLINLRGPTMRKARGGAAHTRGRSPVPGTRRSRPISADDGRGKLER